MQRSVSRLVSFQVSHMLRVWCACTKRFFEERHKFEDDVGRKLQIFWE